MVTYPKAGIDMPNSHDEKRVLRTDPIHFRFASWQANGHALSNARYGLPLFGFPAKQQFGDHSRYLVFVTLVRHRLQMLPQPGLIPKLPSHPFKMRADGGRRRAPS
jgi:hypothetical protein